MSVNKGRILKTRIKLRIDTNRNWEKSTTPLFEGEIGIGYDSTFNRTTNEFEKTNFQIRIGKNISDYRGVLWKNAEPLSAAKITPELKQEIVDTVENDIKDIFVKKTDYDTAMAAINSELAQIKSRLATRVKAFVENSTLNISVDD